MNRLQLFYITNPYTGRTHSTLALNGAIVESGNCVPEEYCCKFGYAVENYMYENIFNEEVVKQLYDFVHEENVLEGNILLFLQDGSLMEKKKYGRN